MILNIVSKTNTIPKAYDNYRNKHAAAKHLEI